MDAQARRAEEALEIEAAMGGALEEVEHPLAGVVRDLRARNAQLEVELKATRSITAELTAERDSLRCRLGEARRPVDDARAAQLEVELKAARSITAELIEEGDNLRKRIGEARKQVDGARAEAATTIRRLERELVVARGAAARASAPATARVERHELSEAKRELAEARRTQERLAGELTQARLMVEALTAAQDLNDLLSGGSARLVALKAKLSPGFIDSMHPVAVAARVMASGIAPMPPGKERLAAVAALYGLLSSFLAG